MKTIVQLSIVLFCIIMAIGCGLKFTPNDDGKVNTDDFAVEVMITPEELKELFNMVFNTRAVGEIRFQLNSGQTIIVSKPVSCDDDDDDSEPMDEDVDTKAFG